MNKVFLIGEAFGKDEMAAGGIPFVGKSGKLLIEAIESVGLKRKDFRIINVFMERPPENDINYFFGGFRQDICENVQAYNGKFLRAEYSFHLDHLEEEIKEHTPELIIGLGNVPFWAFTGNSGGITKARGNILTETYGPIKLTTKYLPTFHPSYMLRNLKNQELINQWKSDILEAKKYI